MGGRENKEKKGDKKKRKKERKLREEIKFRNSNRMRFFFSFLIVNFSSSSSSSSSSTPPFFFLSIRPFLCCLHGKGQVRERRTDQILIPGRYLVPCRQFFVGPCLHTAAKGKYHGQSLGAGARGYGPTHQGKFYRR